MTLPYYYYRSALLPTSIEEAFGYLDDPFRLSSHMSRSSWRMAGSTMKIELDSERGQQVGSRIIMRGRMLGIPLFVNEVVRERDVPRRKVWETEGAQKLIIIDQYRMGFELSTQGPVIELRIFIHYSLPKTGLGHIFGLLFGKLYARWCTSRMVQDTEAHFRNPPTLEPSFPKR